MVATSTLHSPQRCRELMGKHKLNQITAGSPLTILFFYVHVRVQIGLVCNKAPKLHGRAISDSRQEHLHSAQHRHTPGTGGGNPTILGTGTAPKRPYADAMYYSEL